jgi:DNA-3-methyladenine glycosylase
MAARRGLHEPRLLCAGPGRVGQALAIVHAMNGMAVDRAPFELHGPVGTEPIDVVVGPRIGISKAMDAPWRFGLAGSRFVSRPFPRA